MVTRWMITLTKMGREMTLRSQATKDHVRLASILSLKCLDTPEPSPASWTAASVLAPASAPKLAPRPSKFASLRPSGSLKLAAQILRQCLFFPQGRWLFVSRKDGSLCPS